MSRFKRTLVRRNIADLGDRLSGGGAGRVGTGPVPDKAGGSGNRAELGQCSAQSHPE